MRFAIGEEVRVNNPNSVYHDRVGYVLSVNPETHLPYRVAFNHTTTAFFTERELERNWVESKIGQAAHECREQALAAQVELLTHRLVEARMLNDLLQKQHLDDERRMREMGGGPVQTFYGEALPSNPNTGDTFTHSTERFHAVYDGKNWLDVSKVLGPS